MKSRDGKEIRVELGLRLNRSKGCDQGGKTSGS